MIRVRDLEKSYIAGSKKIEVLKGISLTIDAGSYVSVAGPSGSGKSTLFHTLGGLEPIDRGEIWIADQPVHQLNDQRLSQLRLEHIGYVFQQFQLLSTATALENVMLPLLTMFSSQNVKKSAEEALGKVGLGHRIHHLPSKLSGGEQQRVAIARALVTNPSLILADEPTGNLDSETGEKIISLLEEVNKNEGVTVVVITHDQAIAERAAESIHILDGRIVKRSSNRREL